MSAVDAVDLVDTITVASLASRTKFGDRVDGAQRELAARVEDRNESFADADGKEVFTSTWILSLDPITITDRIWLPAADPTKPEESRKPQRTHKARELDGDQITYEVWL